jgi:hypothetical protein
MAESVTVTMTPAIEQRGTCCTGGGTGPSGG